MIQIVLHGQNGAVLRRRQRKGDIPQIRKGLEHPDNFLYRRGGINDLAVVLNGTIQLRQRQKLLGKTAETVCLSANVADEFALGADIHFVLQNGIGQQLDGGQRRFQLMGSIGNKLPAALFRFFQTFGKIVEFLTEKIHFVVTAELDFVGIMAVAHQSDGMENTAQAAGEKGRKNNGEKDNACFQRCGNAQHIGLQSGDQSALSGIILHQIYDARCDAVFYQRNRNSAFNCAFGVDAVKGVVSLQRGDNFRKEQQLALRVSGFQRVINSRAERVRNHSARCAEIVERIDGLPGFGGGEVVKLQ